MKRSVFTYLDVCVDLHVRILEETYLARKLRDQEKNDLLFVIFCYYLK